MNDVFGGAEVKGQFAGHETFPLRLLWLKKAHDLIRQKKVHIRSFHKPENIASLGVGKNMAVSMRYWASAARCIEEVNRHTLAVSDLGAAILADSGFDPYLEHPATLWLVHWNLASRPAPASTIYFAFNGIAGGEFDAETLQKQLAAIVQARGWRGSDVTLERDIEVFLRSYSVRDEVNVEDAAEPLLAELGLVRPMGRSGSFEFVRGDKPTLPDEIFAFALLDFWQSHHRSINTLSAEQICYGQGSPGRVFKLDEDSLVSRLMRLDAVTKGRWQWTDTAGLRQVQKRGDPDSMRLLEAAYGARHKRAP